jgi:hypothetical protein
MAVDQKLLRGDLVSSAREKLLAMLTAENLIDRWALSGRLDNAGMVGADPPKNGLAGLYAAGWVFPGLGAEGRPVRAVEGTGKAAITLHDRGSWAANAHNTAQFPVLTVLTYADISRDACGNPIAHDAELRGKYLAKVVSDCFHDAANEDHDWPNGLFVISSVEPTQRDITDIPDGDGAVRVEQRFNVSLLGDRQ